ncbi:hypothetical protein FJT64_027477 [Amphibalanus amphitrite]|uniref:Uncharacterized protein n=1 Tax=Amphibalanus amphitrite TaxID=1232801 RepID=A0A6A4W3N1_AMPAM|nr:hypothetical protein FJT64_027477 [Amphibalanus amphitrite]
MRRICTIEFESLWVGSARLRCAVGPAKPKASGGRRAATQWPATGSIHGHTALLADQWSRPAGLLRARHLQQADPACTTGLGTMTPY